jgi:hypothetical protein
MIHYIVLNTNGKIKQRGSCPSEEELPVITDHTVEIVPEDDPRKPEKAKQDSYQDFRRMEYPTIGNQLDAIWKALEAFGMLDKNPEVKAIYEQVKAVKSKHPKR